MEKKPDIIKIVIMGAESSGKSVLSKNLAIYFDTTFVPEFAREYLKEDSKVSYKELEFIAHQQIKLEDEILKLANKILFLDTDLINLKFWFEIQFGECPLWLLEKIVDRNYKYYLLTQNDLPWEYDPLRGYPDKEDRDMIRTNYLDCIKENTNNIFDISGFGNQRLDLSIEYVKKIVLNYT